MQIRTAADKVETVLVKNTFFYYDEIFEEQYETQDIGQLVTLLRNFHAEVQRVGAPTRSMLDELLAKPNGLRATLALNGLSNELLKRIITIARIKHDPSLDLLLLRPQWSKIEDENRFSEISTSTLERLVRNDPAFRTGIINLFFEGDANPTLMALIPPLHLRKLSIGKLSFQIADLIDTLVRYKVVGSSKSSGSNNAEQLIRVVLDEMQVPYTSGELEKLQESHNSTKRKMDFIIPDRLSPVIVIESSFLMTTGSGQGDKAKTEIAVRDLLRVHYPQARFIGFVDGVGWYVRKGDLERMITAYDDVFTFHPDELARFRALVMEIMGTQ